DGVIGPVDDLGRSGKYASAASEGLGAKQGVGPPAQVGGLDQRSGRAVPVAGRGLMGSNTLEEGIIARRSRRQGGRRSAVHVGENARPRVRRHCVTDDGVAELNIA